jgi:hypothetical protein
VRPGCSNSARELRQLRDDEEEDEARQVLVALETWRGGPVPRRIAFLLPPTPENKTCQMRWHRQPAESGGGPSQHPGAPPTRRAMTGDKQSVSAPRIGPVRYGGGATAGHLRGDVNLCDRRAHPARVEVVGELLEQRVVVRGVRLRVCSFPARPGTAWARPGHGWARLGTAVLCCAVL